MRTVNSEAFADLASGQTPGWLRTTHAADAVPTVALIACEVLLARWYLRMARWYLRKKKEA